MLKANRFEPVTIPAEFQSDPGAWLAGQTQLGMDLLLAHSEAGVIWGKVSGGQLKLAGDVFPEVNVALLAQTLQQARLFGPTGEVYLWRTGNGFTARRIVDGVQTPADCLEDRHWLWGTVGEKGRASDVFTLLVEGRQGLRHAPPVTGLGQAQRVALTVRHYIQYDPHEGQAYIAGSRLTGLIAVEEA